MTIFIVFILAASCFLFLRRASQKSTQTGCHENPNDSADTSAGKQRRSQFTEPASNPTAPVQRNGATPPSVRENAAPSIGSGTGKWRDPIYRGEQDFVELAMLLDAHPGSTARFLASRARIEFGPDFDKHRINSALYRMWHRGLVEKALVGQVPHWFLK